jgi:hypothetical protein
MKRVFWIALGATAGVLVVRKLQKTAHAYTPDGMAERVQGLGGSIRYFADEVRAGMAEREAELRDALGLNEDELSPDEAADELQHRRSAG